MNITKLAPGSAAGLADPAAPAWEDVPRESVPLAPIPLDQQPTAYIREAWANRRYGVTPQVEAAAATDGDQLYVRLAWADNATPNHEFQDAAGVLFPPAGVTPVFGAPTAPVDLWYWEQGRPAPLALSSRGPGVVRKTDAAVAGQAKLAGGNWALVLRGPAAAAASGRVGFAVWDGSNEERAGLGSVSQAWLTLEAKGD